MWDVCNAPPTHTPRGLSFNAIHRDSNGPYSSLSGTEGGTQGQLGFPAAACQPSALWLAGITEPGLIENMGKTPRCTSISLRQDDMCLRYLFYIFKGGDLLQHECTVTSQLQCLILQLSIRDTNNAVRHHESWTRLGIRFCMVCVSSSPQTQVALKCSRYQVLKFHIGKVSKANRVETSCVRARQWRGSHTATLVHMTHMLCRCRT